MAHQTHNTYTDTTENHVKTTTEPLKVKPRKERKGTKESASNINYTGPVANNENDSVERGEAIMAQDIGLKIYTGKERGWPKNRFSISEFKRMHSQQHIQIYIRKHCLPRGTHITSN